MEYQNLRGGTVVLRPMQPVDLEFLNIPAGGESNDVLLSFEKALNME